MGSASFFSLARRAAGLVGALLLVALIGAGVLMAERDRNRTISLFNIHTKETLEVLYKRNGANVPEAMEKINWILRDWRRNEATTMDPKLIDLMWEVHAELGSREPIHVISGFRSRATNDMLRSTVGGQANQSRHILGQAADVHFPDIPLKNVRYAALVREIGGVGYYPTSALPFVHLDTGNVRHWPRLPRYELALLFPSGRSLHKPADGGTLTAGDVQIAQGRYRELATQLAAFQDRRNGAATTAVALAQPVAPAATPSARRDGAPQRDSVPVVVAAATPAPPPLLVAAPRIIDRPSRLTTRPTAADRSQLAMLAAAAAMTTPASGQPTLVAAPRPAVRPAASTGTPSSLTGASAGRIDAPLAGVVTGDSANTRPQPQLASLTPAEPGRAATLSDAPRFDWGSAWAKAPAFDDEHPEELSYRPFPIAPYMTQTASADDPALLTMRHPDIARTLELMDSAGTVPPMELLPGAQVARLLWAQSFSGEAVAVDDAFKRKPAITSRAVRTAASR